MGKDESIYVEYQTLYPDLKIVTGKRLNYAYEMTQRRNSLNPCFIFVYLYEIMLAL